MELWTIKDVIKNNENGKFLAVCDDGNDYICKFIARNRAMISEIPEGVEVLGYLQIIGRI